MNEVTECANSLLGDFRSFSNQRQLKETEQRKLQEQLNKNANLLKRQFSSVQNEAKTLQDGIVTLENSAPSTVMLKQFCDENTPTSVDAVTLKGEFDECVAPNQDLQKQDYASVRSLLTELKQLTDGAQR